MSKGGGACECPRVGAFFKSMTSHGQCPRGGCLWMSKSGGVFEIDDVTRIMSRGGGAPGVPPIQVQTPPPPGWLATGLHHSSTSSRHSGMARQLKLTATSTLTRAALADYYRPTMVSIFRKRVVGASIRHLFNRQLGCYLYPRRTIALMEALSLARNQRLCTSAEQPIGKWRHRRKSVWIRGRCGVSDRVRAQGPANKYISLRDRRSRRGDTIFGAKFSIRLFRYYIKFLNKENMHTYTPTVFCCIPMAVCHRWSRYLPIYISFARGMLKVTTTYARRMCWL